MFAFWSWTTPMMLQEGMFLKQLEKFCHSNITKSTFYRIRIEFVRGYNMTSDLLKPDFTYFKFVKIYLCTTNQCELRDWVGWVKSRFHSLLVILEGI
ncbi:hypothetical protein HN51_034903 [Arachis hypogaea]